MKFLILVAGIFAAFFLTIFGLSIFLSPNDLGKCGAKPIEKVDSKSCEIADVIVAVSGGSTDRRAAHAIELYKNGWSHKIIFSGANSDPNQPSDAASMRRQALRAGVPESAILTDETSRNTHDNAKNVAQILSQIGAENVILVSDPYHMRRVKMEFQNAAKEITFRTSPTPVDSFWGNWWISPRGWWLVLRELGGILIVLVSGLFGAIL